MEKIVLNFDLSWKYINLIIQEALETSEREKLREKQ